MITAFTTTKAPNYAPSITMMFNDDTRDDYYRWLRGGSRWYSWW